MKLKLSVVSLVGALVLSVAFLDALLVEAQRSEINPKENDRKQTVAAPASPISLSTTGVAVTENFDTLSNTASTTTNALTINGWELSEAGDGTRDNELYAVDTGGSATGDTYSYGSAASTDRALGGLQSGTLIPSFGASFINSTGSAITSLEIGYTGEQWRIGNTSTARDDKLDFQYSLDATSLTTGTWIDVDTLDFTNVIKTRATVGSLDGNDAANRTAIAAVIPSLLIPDGATIYVRWVDSNASGSDDGLAIDDFSIIAVSTVPSAAPASITGRVMASSGAGIRGASVVVQGTDGVFRSATTNTFGYYRVEGLLAGESYLITVSARRFAFANGTRLVNLDNDLVGVDFTASR